MDDQRLPDSAVDAAAIDDADPDPGLASDRTAVPSPDLRARRARAPCGSTRDPDLRNADVLQANSRCYFIVDLVHPFFAPRPHRCFINEVYMFSTILFRPNLYYIVDDKKENLFHSNRFANTYVDSVLLNLWSLVTLELSRYYFLILL